MHRLITSRKRRGVTQFVVVMVLIVVSLIASVALGGFLFGAMATYASSARVAAQVATCSSNGSGEVCTVNLTNTGSSNVATTGSCSLGSDGHKQGTVGSGGTVPAGGTLSVNCMVTGITVSTGAGVTGSISLDNGASVYFAATAS